MRRRGLISGVPCTESTAEGEEGAPEIDTLKYVHTHMGWMELALPALTGCLKLGVSREIATYINTVLPA